MPEPCIKISWASTEGCEPARAFRGLVGWVVTIDHITKGKNLILIDAIEDADGDLLIIGRGVHYEDGDEVFGSTDEFLASLCVDVRVE